MAARFAKGVLADQGVLPDEPEEQDQEQQDEPDQGQVIPRKYHPSKDERKLLRQAFPADVPKENFHHKIGRNIKNKLTSLRRLLQPAPSCTWFISSLSPNSFKCMKSENTILQS